MRTDHPRPIRLKDYRPPEFLIDRVDLDITLHATETRVASRLKIRRNPAVEAGATPLVLDGEHLDLRAIKLDRRELVPADYQKTDTQLTIPEVPDKPFTLEIVTIINPEANKALQGLYRSRGVYCSQCEAQGFRRITYFIDRPDVLSVYSCRIEADVNEAPILLSNGNQIERGTIKRGERHYAVWKDPHPKPCYLFALVGGNLQSIASTFKTRDGREIDLRIYVEPGKESRAHWAMDSLKRSMAWDERRFGRIYDLDVFNIVAVSDFNLGAMENKGLNIFNDRLILATPETATDAAFEAIESVVAHEYFHNWTGNRVTCRDWFQLCLKEGLTVYRDQEFSADERSATVQRIVDVRQLRAVQFPEDQGPLAHPVRPDSYIEINNFYTATVYEKGAELVRMIETIVGSDGFRRGLDLYFERHDGEAATIEQFLACFAEVNDVDLTQFALWYSQAGTPELTCKLVYDAARETLTLDIEQSQPPTPGQTRKKPLHIPVRLGLIAPDGRDMPLALEGGTPVTGGVLHVRKRSERFKLVGVTSAPVPSLLRGFSAPVRLVMAQPDAALAHQMAHDSDLFNRWQAANDFAMRLLVDLVRAPDAGSDRIDAFAEALDRSLADDTLEPAYRAEMLRMPTDGDIAREIGRNVDPEAIHLARRAALKRIGAKLGQRLESLYDRMASRGAFQPDAASAGRRALRNAALSLLVRRGARGDLARLQSHYDKATNMTEAAHALFLIAERSGDMRTATLDDFYARWKDDHVVIDTWFAAQAVAPAAATLKRVRALTRHALFSPTAPNKVRALVSNFANVNQLQFNRADGEGYQFVADQVLSLDGFNPQVAARLLGAFRSWRSLEPHRRRLAKRELSRIANTPDLSRDVYEIVTKTLEAPDSDD